MCTRRKRDTQASARVSAEPGAEHRGSSGRRSVRGAILGLPSQNPRLWLQGALQPFLAC